MSGEVAPAQEHAQLAADDSNGTPLDFWEYAAMKAPDYNSSYYFKGTLAFLAFYFMVHLTCHLIFNRYNSVY